MTRGWDEFAAGVFDHVAPGVVLLLLLAGAGLVAALWYWYPAWVPRRLPRVQLPRSTRRRKRKRDRTPPESKQTKDSAFEPSVVLPDGRLLADRLAAEGRYAEAIRQRLRDVVGDLTVAGVVAPLPGTTVAEVSTTVAEQRPAVAAPLTDATEVFSEIWYGDRRASREHDDHMRTLTGEVRRRMTGDAR
ncbi:DUF4129 domain-containing protein [Symbioplanes lichenis]|uniref:DUF4129 domain-containing protein n=1 Tax=Symbioplanes lichenis TaxID=1629072 RepID=UPI00273A4B8D|nr:DUF4129 domain-containing protein [Actinoplanes lichenis]